MTNSFLCCAEVVGLKLSKDSLHSIEDMVLTNSYEYITDDILAGDGKHQFIEAYGKIAFKKFEDRKVMLFKKLNFDDISHLSSERHKCNLFMSQFLAQLWRIKDNSIFLNEFYYMPLTEGIPFNTAKLNYNMYNASGGIEETEFTEDELLSIPNLYDFYEPFLSPSSKPILFKDENIVGTTVSAKALEYNNPTRISRAMRFNHIARTESSIPLKITNNIAFLECLFSINNSTVTYNVSNRTSLFLLKFNKINKLETKKTVSDCYDIRSKYIHGSQLKKKYSSIQQLQLISIKLDKICREVLNNILRNNIETFNASSSDLNKYYRGLS